MRQPFYFLILTIFFGSLFFASCRDLVTDDPAPDEETDPSFAKEGIYKIVVELSGDIDRYMPDITLCAALDKEKSSPILGHISDSCSLVDKARGFQDTLQSKYLFTVSYVNYPSLFSSPITIETQKHAHGAYVLIGDESLYSVPGSKIKIHAKGYYNGKLIKEDTLTHHRLETLYYFRIGNSNTDIVSPPKE